jgi:hypothetical protein
VRLTALTLGATPRRLIAWLFAKRAPDHCSTGCGICRLALKSGNPDCRRQHCRNYPGYDDTIAMEADKGNFELHLPSASY